MNNFIDQLNPAFAIALDEEWAYLDNNCLCGIDMPTLMEAACDFVAVYCNA